MTMEEVKAQLVKMYHAESADEDMYEAMSKVAEKSGDWKLARGLKMIAHDEDTHKDFLERYLTDHGMI